MPYPTPIGGNSFSERKVHNGSFASVICVTMPESRHSASGPKWDICPTSRTA